MTQTNMLSNIARRLGLAAAEEHTVRNEEQIRRWMMERLARQLNIPVEAVDTKRRFDEYGLDSRVAVKVSGELEKFVERRLSPALLFEQPTVDDVARTLAQDLVQKADD